MENLADNRLCSEDLVEENSETSFEELLGYDSIVVRPSDKSNAPKLKKCLFFTKTGFCKFGRNCKFIHEAAIKSYGLNSKKFTYKNLPPHDNHYRHSHFKNISHNIQPQIFQASNTTTEKNAVLDGILITTPKSAIPEETSHLSGESSFLSGQNKVAKRMFYPSNGKDYKTKSTPLCYYYKKGYCYKGDKCKFFHQKRGAKYSKMPYLTDSVKDSNRTLQTKLLEDENVSNTTAEELLEAKNDSNLTPQEELLKTHSVHQDSINTNDHVIFNKTSNVYELPLLAAGDISKLRATEISQLKKRFPHSEEILTDQTYAFMFEPSDPDWPFDVRKIKIEVNFPESYPKEKCTLTVIKHADNIPDLLIKFLNNTILDWIISKYEENHKSEKIELMFRPFLKWLDKNLEELFICGLRKVKQDIKAKEDGIEFVPVENLFPSASKSSNSSCSNNKEADVSDSVSNLVSLLSQTSISSSKPQPSAKEINNKQFHYVGNNVMKILFSELELVEGAAALICTKVSVTLQCCRCKSTFHAKSVPKKSNFYVCSKCSRNVGFTFEPFTIHQFSNVLGNLYLLDCLTVDMNLVECHFLVDCLNCSKQVPVDGIHYGHKHKLWCTFCHGKMTISIGSTKFQTIKQSSISDTKHVATKRSEKKVKDPVIKEGEPLPDFGACRHFKKSFRWLRFPCCGRLYPCDECHNEKETDHEMKYASRMICGFCSKEQPYSREKPCLLCSQNMTKKSGSHWEGGKGCRNRIQMSREDKQKYAGACKTVSKKAQSLRNPKNKS